MSPRFAAASSTTTATATAQPGRRAAYSEPDSMEVYNDLVVGKYNWVPDDAQPGPATAEMDNLPIQLRTNGRSRASSTGVSPSRYEGMLSSSGHAGGG
ncbi:hypothetical protein ACH4Y0_38120 [Streptomyces sp. NPDC020707]|uniref:hypothetical protein n=1 Tax=Streptomyces sp. NPDC020707 TaxID=3365084 RepID=UPI0037B450A3